MVLPVTEVAAVGNNNVVPQGDAKQLPCCGKLLGECDIFAAWVDITRGVVMGDNNAGGSVHQWIGEYFARMGQDGIERADGDCALGDKALATV